MSEEMKKLEARCALCGNCPLGATRTKLVFGVGKAPSELMLIGDSLSADILGANRAGVPSCWFNPSGAPLKGEARPDHIIRELKELPAILC